MRRKSILAICASPIAIHIAIAMVAVAASMVIAMIYTPMTKKAMRLAYQAHHGQVDKSGLPYIFHPLHLAERMRTEDTITVALLHDVVEDTPITLRDLEQAGFPEHVLQAVKVLTHQPEEPYLDYVARVKQNPLARAVKMADIQHNQDITRLDKVDERTLARLDRYRQALALLQDANLSA